MKKQTVLFDMDGCKADFTGGVLRFLSENFPHIKLTREDLSHWDIFSFIKCEIARAAAIEHIQTPDFFLELDPVPKAIEAFQRLVMVGHTVRICTTPLPRIWPAGRMYSVRAKSQWVRKHLGRHAAANIIFAENKTIHPADVIIDDKPDLTFNKNGIQFDYWLIVDHPYNRVLPDTAHLPSGRIHNDWSNWEEEFAKRELI